MPLYNPTSGVTNSASVDVIPKSDGTNLLASNATELDGLFTIGNSANSGSLKLKGSNGNNSNGVTLRVSNGEDPGTEYTLTFPHDLVSGGLMQVDAGGNLSFVTALSVSNLATSGGAVIGGTLEVTGNIINSSATVTANTVNANTLTIGGVEVSPPLGVYLGSDYTNATASFTNTGISVILTAGKKYAFELRIYASNSTAADGFQIDFNGGASTATNFIAGSSTSLVTGTTTSLSGTFSNGTLTGTNMVVISGSIEVNAGGTFVVRARENAHTTGTLTILRGSSLILTQLP